MQSNLFQIHFEEKTAQSPAGVQQHQWYFLREFVFQKDERLPRFLHAGRVQILKIKVILGDQSPFGQPEIQDHESIDRVAVIGFALLVLVEQLLKTGTAEELG